jgi:hypothetical protein
MQALAGGRGGVNLVPHSVYVKHNVASADALNDA